MFNTTYREGINENTFKKIKQIIETNNVRLEERSGIIIYFIVTRARNFDISVSISNSFEHFSFEPGYSLRVSTRSIDNENNTVTYRETTPTQESAETPEENTQTFGIAKLFDLAEKKYEAQEQAIEKNKEQLRSAHAKKLEKQDAREKATVEAVEAALDSLFN